MRSPYVASDLIAALGQTKIDRMTFTSIDGFPEGVVIRGTLRETSSKASVALRGYVDNLRRNPAVGPLFSGIALISLDRNEGGDELTFEIACKLKATPGGTAP